MKPNLWIIVPCYNEEKVLPITCDIFLNKITELENKELISKDSKILFVDDGSKDGTWEIIENLSKKDNHFIGISQSRNRGHQNAVLAGLMEAKEKCDITISIDCDGQDDVNAMEDMIKEYLEGAEIVYGVRSKRKTDTIFKRFTAKSFYRLLKIMGVDVVFNHADYRLVSSKVLKEFENFKEVNIFLRGMFPLVGFKSTSIYYERKERIAGKSKYPLSKMIGLALDGITSLSIRPIRIITTMGMLVALLGVIGIIWVLVTTLTGNSVIGWASTLCIILFVSGVQLISIGVIGEYVGKIYMEVKARPRYIISKKTYENK